jgi:hypothetical protein
MVGVAELVRGVNVALNRLALDTCPAFDRSRNGTIEISELIAAVRAALDGCG